MLFIQRAWGCCQEIAGSFADVDEGCGARVADVGPEIAGREGFADSERDAAQKIRESADAAGAVVEGHAVVPSVAVWSRNLA